MVYAGILAGGYGWDQVKSDMPKQFMQIGTKPMIIHTIEQFVVNDAIDRIIVAAPENWIVYTKDLVKKYISTDKEIAVIMGGRNKNNTLKQIVSFIDENYQIGEKDIIIGHDAIRPFVTQRIIEENLEVLKKYDSASTAVPTIDTIIKAKENGQIESITPERVFYSEQTPQTFKLEKLASVYRADELPKKHVNAIKMFVEAGHSVSLVKGAYSNIKIVTQYDLEVANAILRDKNDD